MPKGSYLTSTGRVEAFSCAPGPAGWRFVSEDLDLACDATFHPIRFKVGSTITGRGGRLEDGTPVLIWTGTDERERISRADVLLNESAGGWIAAARQVALPGPKLVGRTLIALQVAPEGGVLLAEYRLTRVAVEQHDSDTGPLLVETWHADDSGLGVRRQLYLAGDVLLQAHLPDREVELIELDSPPNQYSLGREQRTPHDLP